MYFFNFHFIIKNTNKLLEMWEKVFSSAFFFLHHFPSQAPPLQTPSEIKVENEAPLQVDLSSPGSPESSSSMSDDSQDSRVWSKVEHTHTHTQSWFYKFTLDFGLFLDQRVSLFLQAMCIFK